MLVSAFLTAYRTYVHMAARFNVEAVRALEAHAGAKVLFDYPPSCGSPCPRITTTTSEHSSIDHLELSYLTSGDIVALYSFSIDKDSITWRPED